MRIMYSVDEEPSLTFYYTLDVTESESLDECAMEARVRALHAEEWGFEQTLNMSVIKKVGTL